MKAVAFSVRPFEKEYLAKANQKKHDITLISNPLGVDTAVYAEGKNAVIVFDDDDLSAPVIERLAALGVKFIVTRSGGTSRIDKAAALANGIKIASIPTCLPQTAANPDAEPVYINNANYYATQVSLNEAGLSRETLQEIADQTIKSLDLWSLNKCVGPACACANDCNKNIPAKTT